MKILPLIIGSIGILVTTSAVKAEDDFDRGLAYSKAEKYSECKKSFSSYIKKTPKTNTTGLSNAYYYRGYCEYYGPSSNYNSVISDMNKAISIRPDDVDFYDFKARALYHQRRYGEQQKVYNQGMKVKPDQGLAFYMGRAMQNKARIAFKSSEKDSRLLHDRAVKYFSQAISIDPSYKSAYFYRALSYAIWRVYSKACVDFKKAQSLGYQSKDLNKSIKDTCSKRADGPQQGGIRGNINPKFKETMNRERAYRERCTQTHWFRNTRTGAKESNTWDSCQGRYLFPTRDQVRINR